MNDIVIGSGPAGHATIMGLLARGRPVTVVDAGHTLEPESEARMRALAAAEPDAWEPGAVARYKASNLDGTDQIRRYGSSFALRPRTAVLDEPPPDFGLQSSHARGGLSNVWGAAVLPWRGEDMQGWPVAAEDLRPHYRAVSEFLPIAGERSALDGLFPAADTHLTAAMPETGQSRMLRMRFARAEKQLARAGLTVGPARQAVFAGCRSCGLCLHGCPYGLIYAAGEPVADLARAGRIAYLPGCEVSGIEETGTGVRLLFPDGRPPVTGDRVFLAAGVLETARLQFASNPALVDREILLSESRHFFTPFLFCRAVPGTGTDPHHSLVLAFAELIDPDVSPGLVHTQLYGWNEFYARDMIQRYGRGRPVAGRIFDAMALRMIVGQSFLHSSHCPRIALSAERADGAGRLRLRLAEEPAFAATVARARRALARGMRAAGLFAISPAGRTGAPGSSFHVGGSFPMRAVPGPGETDVLGRPFGRTRVHIVDASVMPEIPASTITLSVMANAHRIATLA